MDEKGRRKKVPCLVRVKLCREIGGVSWVWLNVKCFPSVKFVLVKIFSIVWLCSRKYARKWFLVFGLHVKWLPKNM